jgi:hypothetical protein
MEIEKLRKIAIMAVQSTNANERDVALEILKKNGVKDPYYLLNTNDIFESKIKPKKPKYNNLKEEYFVDFIEQIDELGYQLEHNIESTFQSFQSIFKKLLGG